MLSRGRARLYAAALVAVWVGICGALAVKGWWLVDPAGRPVTTNFLLVWGSGRLALAGDAAAAYDWDAIARVEATATAPGQPMIAYLYPPTFMLVAALFALLPFLWSSLLWLGLTCAGYLAALRAILPGRSTVLFGLAAPPVFINVIEVEQGFAVAALAGTALALLETRPVLAGVALGLLTFKPQLGLIFPLVLLVTGRWRTIVAAGATGLALALLAALAFGPGVWAAFLKAGPTTFDALLGRGTIAVWADKQTWYSVARYFGATPPVAGALHAVTAGASALAICWLWRRPVPYEFKAAAAAVGCVLLTPFIMSYDTVVLAVAVAFLVRRNLASGFQRGDLAACGIVLFAPLYPLVANGIVPLLPAVHSLFLIWILHRARPARRELPAAG